MIRKALSGLRVIDFTQIGAGPTCTMLLADMGADVVKVEPLAGDVARGLGPPWYGAQSPVFLAFNRGKRSIALDLKRAEGREVALSLVARADVVVESFRPGVFARLGLNREAVEHLNPEVIYCAVSGYGQSGPCASRAGVDGIMQAASGLMGLLGAEGDGPSKVQAPIVDVFSGYVAALGVLANLVARGRGGSFSSLDVSLFASAVALQQSAVTTYFGEGRQPARIGSAAPYSTPNEAFETGDGWIMVAAYLGDRWPRLCALLGRSDLAEDPRMRTAAARLAHRAEMADELTAVFRTQPTAHWLAVLESEDILCAAVAGYDDLTRHPQFRHLNLAVSLGEASPAPFRTVGLPVDPVAANAESYRMPPGLGEHSHEVLYELGLAEDEISHLLALGIVAEGSAIEAGPEQAGRRA